MRIGWGAVIAAVWTATMLLTAVPAVAQELQGLDRSEEVLFRADQLREERDVGLVVATGNVEFTQGARTLLADTVTYNRRTDTVTAAGNIALMEPTGEVIFADHVELSGDLKNGLVENLRVRLTDDARIAAAGGRRIGGTLTRFAKAVYSPCKLCKDEPTRAPIGQIKAVEVEHDQTTKDIEYKDATLEFYGVPVLYSPYLSHPDPTVERRTGFLAPTYGSDSDLGLILRTPYYINIAPNMDATLSPLITTNEGPVAAGEFRHRLTSGEYDLAGSLTYSSYNGNNDQVRGHFRSNFDYDINSTWRGGSRIYLTSDDTYLRRYGFDSEDTLENRLFVEGFRGRNYAAANAYYFQGLRSTDSEGDTPIVFPMLDFNHVGDPDRYGGTWKVDANLLTLTRTHGTDSRRISVKPQWELPYTSPAGEVYRVFASVQADAYWTDEVENTDVSQTTESGVTGRFFPQVGVDWRLPLARTDGRYTQIVEPIVGIILAPDSQNPGLIPNEDSLSFEFDDTNLLSDNRFSGLDRVEGGPRINYGIHSGIFGLAGGFSSFFIGQSYRFSDGDDFGAGTGLEDHFSDIVGRLRIAPIRYITALYRFRLNNDDLSPNRSELQANVGVEEFLVDVNYLSVEQQAVTDISDPEDEFRDREEITLGISSKFTDRWSAGIHSRRDLTTGGGSLRHGAFLMYEDDCFQFRTDFTRTFTRDRDIQPTDTILFRIVFKTLGEFETSTAAN